MENLFPMLDCHGVVLEEATVDQLQDAMNMGQLTSTTIALCYLQRIYQTDEYTNAILELNPDFLEIASNLDAERDAGATRGPLHGIPFVVKDNIATKDKMETTAGSWALLGSIVPRDAHVISRLRQAGALLLGKTTLSEWADMRSSDYSEGYSARGGQARSPYNLTLNPGGSSSGSAGAVAGNLFRDAVYALDVIYGIDVRDNFTLAQVGKTPDAAYSQFLTNSDALQNATFGLPWQSFWAFASEEQQVSLLGLIEAITRAGATVINGTELPNYQTIVSPDGWNWCVCFTRMEDTAFAYLVRVRDYGTTRGYPNESEFTYVKVDFYNNIKTYLAELQNTAIKSLDDIVQYNYDNDGTEGGTPNVQPAFASGQDSFLASLATNGIMNSTYYEALSFCQRSTREDGIDAALRNNGKHLSALLVPPDVAQTYQIAAQAGYPMITLPASVNSSTGMPFGLALMGTAWSEAELVKWASAIEDLLLKGNGTYGRSKPMWYGYKQRNIPVLNL
ncbi:MAG: hypothetical protein ASARMPREDX12_003019 [Alectoria sarmentosa]|nr:MAG: hypothetical protein ASARMPREDX12_003019 [Alectoria sarmentosa]